MRYCFPCDRNFATDARFVRHLTEDHGAPRARVERAIAEWPDAALVAVVSDAGVWFLMAQPALL